MNIGLQNGSRQGDAHHAEAFPAGLLPDPGRAGGQWLGAGGQAIRGPAGRVAVTSNLTPDAGGLKDWSDAQIARALREGLARDGTPWAPVMAFDWYKDIDEPDMAALIAYLRSLPPQPFGGAH